MKFFRNLLVYFATFVLGALSCIGQAVRFEVTEAATGAPLSTLVNLAAGTPTNIRVTVLDETGQPVINYAKDVTVSFRAEFGQQTDLVVLGAQFINGVAGEDGSIAITPEYSATQRIELDNNGLPYETGARASVTDGNIITDNASGFFSVAPARFDVTYSGTDTPLSQHKIADERSYLLRVTARNADIFGSVATGYRGTVNLSSTSANITVGSAIINFGGVADLIPMQTDQAEVGVSIDAADAVTNTVGASATFEIGVAGTSGGDATRLTVANLSFRRGGTAANQFTILVYRLTNSTTQPTIDPIAGPIDTHFRLLDPTGSPIYIWSEESTTGDLAASGGNTGDLTTSFSLPANMRPGTYTIQVQPGYGARNQGTINVTLGNSADLAVTQFNYVPGQYRGGDALRMDLTWQNLLSQFPSANTLTSALAADAGHAYMIEAHLSTNPTYGDEDDFLVWQESFVGNGNNVLPAGDLLPGQQVDITRYIKLPENFTGTYYLLARVNSAGGVNGTGIDDEHVPGVIVTGNNTVLAFEAQKITLLPKQATNTFRISLTNAGGQAGALSDNAAISRDGQYVAFESLAQLDANPVVANNTNIYLRNVEGGATSLVSLGSGSTGANGSSGNPELTADGRYVVFQSQASNLVPGDTNGVSDIFIRDVQLGITRRVSINPATGNQANNGSQLPSISADGRFVVFESGASNLTSDSVQFGVNRVYLLDRDADNDGILDEAGAAATSIVLVTKPANIGDLQTSTQPRISADGNYVAFVTRATVLLGQSAPFPQIVRWDRQADTFAAVTRSLITPADLADNESGFPAINADGSYVAFASRAQNLTADAYTESVPHVFRAKFTGGAVTEVLRMNSRRNPLSEGEPDNFYSTENFSPDLGSFEPSMSDDGQLVAFASESLDLLPPITVKNIDRTTFQTRFVNNYFDNNFSADVYLYDFSASSTPEISRASVSRFGYEATSWTTTANLVNLHRPVSRRPVISGDGRYVAFTSDAKGHSGLIFGATNFDYEATNDPRDIYVYDRKAGLPAYSNLPQVSLLNTPIDELSVGQTFTFVANASSSVRSISSVEFYANNSLIGTATTPATGNVTRFSVEWTAPSPGAGNTSAIQYQISAIAVDSNGLRSNISNFVGVTVNQVSGNSPSVVITNPVAVTTGTITTPVVLPVGSSIPFFARVTPGSAAIASVEFFATNAATGANYLGAASAFDGRIYGLNNYVNTLAQGSYTLTAVVTDAAGNIIQSAGTTISVTGAGVAAPTISLAAPAPTVISLGQPSNLSATVTPADQATITQVVFYANGSVVGTVTNSPYLLNYTTPATGTYTIQAVATDSQGNTSVSSTQTLTVNALVGTAPTVTLTDTTAIKFATTSRLPLSAVVTLGNSPVSTLRFFASNIVSGATTLLGSGELVAGSTTYQLVYTNDLAAGDYSVYAVVTDTNGNIVQSATRSVSSVSVTAPSVRIISPAAGSYKILDSTSFAAASARVTTRAATNPTFNGDQDIIGIVIEDAGLNYAAGVTAYIEIRNDPVFGGGIARTEPLTVTLGADGIISNLALTTGGNARLFFYQSAVVVIEDSFNIPALTVVTSPTSSTGVDAVRLYANGVLIGSKASPPYTFVWSPSRSGTYSLHAEITDSDGISSASETVIIIIDPVEEVAPVETLAAIESAYQAILGRSPTNDETVSAVNRFGVGLTAGQVAALLLQSSDFRDDQAELLLSYLAVWGEYPNTAQYAFLEGQRSFELSDVQIVDSLLASEAYKGRFGDIADLSTVSPTQYNRVRALALRTYRNLYGRDPSGVATSNVVAKQFFYTTATLLQTPGQAVVNFINANFAGGKGGTTLTRLRVAGAILLIGKQQPTKARIDALMRMPLSAVADYYFEGGEPYSAGTLVSIDTATGDEEVGVTYHASGLPKGLTIDRATGVISGRLPASVKSYAYSYWTQLNGVRGQTFTRILVVDPLDSKFVGSSESILLDGEGLPAGKLTLKVNSTAAYTGTLAYGDGQTYAFKGVLSVVQNDEGIIRAIGEQSPIVRKAPLEPLQVDILFSGDGDAVISVTEGDDIDAAAVGEAIRVFTFTKSAPAPWQGKRKVELSDVSTVTFFAESAGSGTLNVANSGILSVALRGEDGARITASIPSSVASEYSLYSRPYSKNREGYFAGSLKFSDEATPSVVVFPEEGNDLAWLRPAGLAPLTDGFGPLKIQVLDVTD